MSHLFQGLRRQQLRSLNSRVGIFPRRSTIEHLEDRCLLTAAPQNVGGQLLLTGNPTTYNTITVSLNGSTITANVDGIFGTFAANTVKSISVWDGNAGNSIAIGPKLKVSTHVYGGSGKDYISADAGPTTVLGGSGSDTIVGNGGSNYFQGGSQANDIIGGTGQSTLYGGNGNDTIVGGNSNDLISGGAGKNSISQAGKQIAAPADGAPAFATSPQAAIIDFKSTNSIYAGMGVEMDATSSTVNVSNTLTATYHWNFGDHTSSSEFNNYDSWTGGHVYNVAGTYNIRVSIYNGNTLVATAVAQIFVKPTSLLRPIYVSATGNDANNGSDPNHAIKTIGRLQQLLSKNTAVFFQDGGTYTVGATPLNFVFSNIEVGSYGKGSQPLIMYNGPKAGWNPIFAYQIYTTNISVNGLAFDCLDTSEAGVHDAFSLKGNNLAIRGCTFYHMNDDFNANGNPTGVILQDNTSPSASDLYAYFAWLQGSDILVMGNTVANSVDQHIVRLGGANNVLVLGNNLTNNSRGVVTAQAGKYVNVTGNTLHGASGVGPLQFPDQAPFSYAVFSDNQITGTLDVDPGASEVLMTNNVVNIGYRGVAFQIHGNNPSLDRVAADVFIKQNTVILTGTEGSVLAEYSPGQDITLSNNLFVAPQLTIADNVGDVIVDAPNLSSFSQIKDNIWQIPTAIATWAQGGEFFVSTAPTREAYLSPEEWAATGVPTGDQYADVRLTSTYQFSASGITAGAAMSR